MELYFVYCINSNGDVLEKRVTNKENLEHCVKMAKNDWSTEKVHVNKAGFCFDGYLVQSDFVGLM